MNSKNNYKILLWNYPKNDIFKLLANAANDSNENCSTKQTSRLYVVNLKWQKILHFSTILIVGNTESGHCYKHLVTLFSIYLSISNT